MIKKKSFSTSSIIPDYKEVIHLSHNQAAHLPVRQLQLYLQTEEVDPTHSPDEQDGEMLVVVVEVTMMVVVQEAQEEQGQEEKVKKVVQRWLRRRRQKRLGKRQNSEDRVLVVGHVGEDVGESEDGRLQDEEVGERWGWG